MPEKSKASQEFVPVKEIRDGIAILKDEGFRGVLLASSLNFALKSQEEQESTLFQFQNFLNSLDFEIQFYIQSRKLDIRPYVALLEERYTAQKNELMKIQTREYIEFIKTFTESANIMAKSFFIVVPYTPSIVSSKRGVLSGLLGKKGEDEKSDEKSKLFQENKSQLNQRMGIVEQGLLRTGIRTVRLGTEELVELYFKMLNPGETEKPIINS